MHLKLRPCTFTYKLFVKHHQDLSYSCLLLKCFIVWKVSLAGHIKSMPKICPTGLQPALAKGCGPLQKKCYVCPYARPSNPFFSLSLQLLWKPLGKLKLPFRHQERSLACLYLALLTFFPHLVLPFIHCYLLCYQSCHCQSKAGCFVKDANINLENQTRILWQLM